MKIFTARQTHQLDEFTIENTGISSIDLMERASMEFTIAFASLFLSKRNKIIILCGTGNNGGDGFAVARLLHGWSYEVSVIHALVNEELSPDCSINKKCLPSDIDLLEVRAGDELAEIREQTILIDAFFGSGLSRPIEGYWGDLIQYFNEQDILRVAVDVPSGLFTDRHSEGNILKADHTIIFQFPKLAFFFAENEKYVGKWQIVDIGLSEKGIEEISTDYFQLNNNWVASMLKKRRKFDHKGTFGHALIVGGSYGKMGAAVLSSKAALKVGAGLVSAHIPKCGYDIMQISLPEAMVFTDNNNHLVSQVENLGMFKAVGIGPGLGIDSLTVQALRNILESTKIPLVLDADALNIISKNEELFDLIPENSILTPHPKEFERLFGKSKNEFERMYLQIEKSKSLKIYILLKGGYTCITSPEEKVYFSSAGNPGMGTGGSGDVLTGMLTGLLAQQYNALESCLIGVHLHGMAGDLAAEEKSMESLVAGDIIDYIGSAYFKLFE